MKKFRFPGPSPDLHYMRICVFFYYFFPKFDSDGSWFSRPLNPALFSFNANVFRHELLKLWFHCLAPNHMKEENKENTVSNLPFCLQRLLSRARSIEPVTKPVVQAAAPPT